MPDKKPVDPSAHPEPSTNPLAASQLPPEQLRDALKAFKKRLKLTRLDDESRLGHGAVTKGGRSGVQAIQPPLQYPKAVWDELVRQGRLKNAGHGLYTLGNERSE
ncbi:MAG TPA: hypothetical protein PLL20_18435 [Phycisphaerae bacterium]|jgi:hypothetical protein|nr:hypothetical protein [Phycisphaerae bacterium]HRR85872.1 hypothetical protein [Phycisphaerae bacterium]